jgi:hypothetical protein
VYIFNKEKKSKQQPRLHLEGKIILKRQMYTVVQDAAYSIALNTLYKASKQSYPVTGLGGL